MHIEWLSNDTARITYKHSTLHRSGRVVAECLIWRRIEGDDDSHMARTCSSQIVITDSQGQYWVSLIYAGKIRQRHADQDLGRQVSLDKALIKATEWALTTIARLEARG